MTIRLEKEGSVKIVSINRPDAKNAVDTKTAGELFDCFLEFEQDPEMSVAILSGEGGAFCAGFDLKHASDELDADALAELDIPDDWQDPVAMPLRGPMGPTRLMLSKPVIAAISGPAVAGGMELAAWCDLRVVDRSAYFGVYCRRWGIPLIDGGTVRLPHIVGYGRAMDLILTGRRVDASEALDIGLANRLADEGVVEAALAIATELSALPQACLLADRQSAQGSRKRMAHALRREWRSARVFEQEGPAGAQAFTRGQGRSGTPRHHQ